MFQELGYPKQKWKIRLVMQNVEKVHLSVYSNHRYSNFDVHSFSKHQLVEFHQMDSHGSPIEAHTSSSCFVLLKVFISLEFLDRTAGTIYWFHSFGQINCKDSSKVSIEVQN